MSSPFLAQVGATLRAARARAGATLDQVAAQAGTTKSTLSKWENGKVEGVPLGKLEQYTSGVLGCGVALVLRPGAPSTARLIESEDDPHTARVVARVTEIIRRLPSAAHRDQALVAMLTVEQLARASVPEASSDL